MLIIFDCCFFLPLSGEGVVPEPAHQAEEGSGEGLGASLGRVRDGGDLQRAAAAGTGASPDPTGAARATAPLRLRFTCALPRHHRQRRLRWQRRNRERVRLRLGGREPPVAGGDQLRDGGDRPAGVAPRPPRPVQLPRAVAARLRGLQNLLLRPPGHGRLAGREPAGTVGAVPQLIRVRAVLPDQWQRRAGQESSGMISVLLGFFFFFQYSLLKMLQHFCS